MAPTFQTVFFFTTIGLSFAAPSGRQVRWCTISDLEQKKCNDLVGSCNVPDFTLVCVHKSSTEGCMTAIKDGQADSMFLDSGASMDPYSLKPIISEPYSSQKELSKCLMERQEALGGDEKVIGQFVPHCDEKGDYQPQQCHGSTGYCWCVNAIGEEIAGTKTPPGQTPATCKKHELTKCLKQRQEALAKKLRGHYIPQCDEKGNYKPRQCHGSTGHCWCVKAMGEEIAGTRTPPGQAQVTCDRHDLPKCLKKRQEALGEDEKVIGRFVPNCDEKGEYQPQQCNGSTGYCWCVNAIGEEIAGTKTPPGQTPATCEKHDLPKCLKELQEALGVDEKVIGRFVSRCDEKGDYQPQQCHGSTGYCWCVNAIGEEIAGTKTPPGQTPATCKKQELTKCLKQRQEALGKKLRGHYIPQCDEKGNYQPQQCHGSTGHCWCVKAMGEEIAGTKTPPGQTPATCERHDLPKCLKERQEALRGDEKVIGRFVPDCDEKGDYQPQQCHGSIGYCWCVNEKGEEIVGTKTPPGQTPATCKKQEFTKCLKQRQEALGKKLRGHYIPQCDEKGRYQPQQCNGSTGHCWCVKAMGEEIAGTRTPPGQTPATCEKHDLSKCLKERQEGSGGDEKVIGGFFPVCDRKGDYQPQQCHGSTGYCWCVNAIGEEIAGTKTSPAQTSATCEKHDLTKCLKQRQEALGKKLIGHYIPQCDEKGNYIPQQCHGSTGHCWCVGTMGEEIAGTKTPPGQTRATCERHELTKCLKQRQEALGKKLIGHYIPQCDEKGHYQPQQCHGSTGHCWCVKAMGEEIAGTKTPPGQTPATCERHDLPKCMKERQVGSGGDEKVIGRFFPDCDEKGDYQPQQCHDSTGYCWCVNAIGEEIAGTKTPPGKTPATCTKHDLTKCLKQRQEALGKKLIGHYIPQCDEKGNYIPQQCHGSTGHCWCVGTMGDEIAGTKTPPGQTRATCERHDWDYAIAVVKKSSTFQFNQLKGKKSCHSGFSKTDGWKVPINVLVEKKLLSWDDSAKESIEKAVSKFFSASCIPGATETNLCMQCKGEGRKKCKSSHDEPFYGKHGAFRCLKEEKGDVAFLKSTALSDEHSEEYELLCSDNTRTSINKYKECNLGKVPADVVVTRKSGDKTDDINKFLMEAQKKQCKLFSSSHGKDLMFDDSTKQLALLSN